MLGGDSQQQVRACCEFQVVWIYMSPSTVFLTMAVLCSWMLIHNLVNYKNIYKVVVLLLGATAQFWHFQRLPKTSDSGDSTFAKIKKKQLDYWDNSSYHVAAGLPLCIFLNWRDLSLLQPLCSLVPQTLGQISYTIFLLYSGDLVEERLNPPV